jgi:alkyldihydroxyacetonephosphate synthase
VESKASVSSSSPVLAASESPVWIRELESLFPPERLSTAPEDLWAYRRDMWAREMLAVAAGEPSGHLPDAVVWPKDTQEVQDLVAFVTRQKVPLTPFGGGSGVTGGATPSEGGLVVDCKRLRKFELDSERLCVRVGAGWNGWHVERALSAHGLSIGHFPSSIMCSTVGGWVATRGAGQMSSKYGKIEDMVSGLTVVTGTGERLDLGCANVGADLAQLVVGSEGRLGVVTEVELSVQPLPVRRLMRGYWFPDVKTGCEAMRQVMQSGLRPSVLRLYDEIDTLIAGMGHKKANLNRPLSTNLRGPVEQLLGDLAARVLGSAGPKGLPLEPQDLLKLLQPDAERVARQAERFFLSQILRKTGSVGHLVDAMLSRLHVGCMLIVGCEGEPATASLEEQLVREEILRCGGKDLGPEPGEHWLRHRYDVSFKWGRVLGAGAIADTMEFAATWDKVGALYDNVRAKMQPHALLMAHLSHAYPDGCSIYFTFMARGSGKGADVDERAACVLADQRRYEDIWQAGVSAAFSAGATMGHHHGVGRLRASFQQKEQGAGLSALRTVIRAADPLGVLNPGRLIPTVGTDEGREETPVVSQGVAISNSSLLATVAATQTLGEIEKTLRNAGFSLGGLPPFAYSTTLREALSRPQPLWACLSSGRLADRRLQLFVSVPGVPGQKRVLAVPPRAAPRRSTGPDLAQVFSEGLSPQSCEIVGATLRIEPYLRLRPAVVLPFSGLREALRTMYLLRRWHGGTALHQMLLFSRSFLLDWMPRHAVPDAEFALFVEGGGPLAFAQETIRELTERLEAKTACREPSVLWKAWSRETENLCDSWTGPRVFERPLLGKTLAEQVAELAGLPSRFVVAGMHRHGAAVGCLDPLPGFERALSRFQKDAADGLLAQYGSAAGESSDA